MTHETVIQKYEPLIKKLTEPYPSIKEDLAQLVRIQLLDACRKERDVHSFSYVKKLISNTITVELKRSPAFWKEIPYGLPKENSIFDKLVDEEDSFSSIDLEQWINQILTPQELLCIQLRVLSNPCVPLRIIARRLNTSNEQVRRITKRACKQIHEKIMELD